MDICPPPPPPPTKRALFDLKPIETQRFVVETKMFTTPLESIGFNIVYLSLELKVLGKLGIIKIILVHF